MSLGVYVYSFFILTQQNEFLQLPSTRFFSEYRIISKHQDSVQFLQKEEFSQTLDEKIMYFPFLLDTEV